MNKLRIGVLILVVMFFYPILVSAETILLKSGKTVEGKLIERADSYITIDFEGVTLTYFLDEIESIDGQKQPVVLLKKDPVLEPQKNETSKNSAQLNTVQEKNIEEDGFSGVTSANLPVRESFQQTKPRIRQTQKYAIGPKQQTNKALLPVTVAMVGTFLVLIIAILLVFYIYSAICLQLIAKKTGQEPSWLAWVPIANLFLSCKISGLSYLWLLILFAAPIPIIGPLCITVFYAYLWCRIAVALNKPSWLGVLVIIPIVNLVIIGYLAFSKD